MGIRAVRGKAAFKRHTPFVFKKFSPAGAPSCGDSFFLVSENDNPGLLWRAPQIQKGLTAQPLAKDANAVQISLNRLANRIDQGFNVEVRVEPAPKKDTEDESEAEIQEAISRIEAAAANMQFLKWKANHFLSCLRNYL